MGGKENPQKFFDFHQDEGSKVIKEKVTTMSFQIAIDGPVAAGKGTVARLVAQRLNALYIDTGAMYRMTALLALRNNINFSDEAAIVTLLAQTKMEMRNPLESEKDSRTITVLLNGEDVSWKIRTEDVSAGSSKVAALPKVREHLVAKQQEIASNQDVVMEGRDITYRVLPTAQLKIYLNASPEARAKRRHFELQTRGQDVPFDKVYQDLIDRDNLDMSRAADPLQVVDDAWVIDTTPLTIEEVVDLIVSKVESMKHEEKKV
jgi:cytidylate kinase